MIDVQLPPRPKDTIPIVADGPFAPAYRIWQLRPPQDTLAVIVKTTFAIVPGAAAEPLADQPPPSGDLPFDADACPAGAPVRHASDFAPFKPRADVLLVGHAYPPSPRAAVANVQMVFGSAVRVALAAIGDREWRGQGPSEPRPFARIPLRHERAFGGPGHPANPAGIGLAGARLPNLERPDALIRSPLDRPVPVCFAPVPETWPARASKLGSYDAAWLKERWPWFPRDFDNGHFNAAPPEQQIPYPRGDEEFHLGGVHPEHKVVSGRLPGLVPRAFLQLGREHGFRFREIPLNLDTVWFDADALHVELVFRGLVDVSGERAPEVAAIFVGAGRVGVPANADAAQQRYFELTGAGAPSSGPAGPEERPRPVPAPPAMDRARVEALLASGATLAGAVLSGCDLMHMDLAGKNLGGAIMQGAYLDGARLDGADLRGAVLTGASAPRTSFRGANLGDANLAEASLAGSDFGGAVLDRALLAQADASSASFAGASLAGADLTDARLDRAVFDEAKATAANLSGAALAGASFRRATLDDVIVYDAGAEGACFDDASLLRFRADGANLARGSFARAKADGASYKDANLGDATFAGAQLQDAVFADANLTGANLTRVAAKGARFQHARLARAVALGANLMEADFESADLAGADLRGANLHGAETWKAALAGAKLDQAIITGTKLRG